VLAKSNEVGVLMSCWSLRVGWAPARFNWLGIEISQIFSLSDDEIKRGKANSLVSDS